MCLKRNGQSTALMEWKTEPYPPPPPCNHFSKPLSLTRAQNGNNVMMLVATILLPSLSPTCSTPDSHSRLNPKFPLECPTLWIQNYVQIILWKLIITIHLLDVFFFFPVQYCTVIFVQNWMEHFLCVTVEASIYLFFYISLFFHKELKFFFTEVKLVIHSG